MNPFQFIAAINETKENLFEDPQAEKDYSPFMVNRGLSYFADTILYANEMNMNTDIPKQWQFSFPINSIPKKRRFSKWTKKDQETKDMQRVMEYYGYSAKQAKQVVGVLTKEQLKIIEEKIQKGGK